MAEGVAVATAVRVSNMCRGGVSEGETSPLCVSTTEYTSFNKPKKTIDALGRVTSLVYDAFGQNIQTIAPDGSTTSKTFDAEGNVNSTTDALGRTTNMLYDFDNRLVGTSFVGGASVATEYDAQGRRLSSTDANSNKTSYTYDVVGRNTSVTDALGNTTTYVYDAVGRKTSMTDALGHTTSYEYDLYDRLTKTTYHDGTFSSTVYDVLGRKTSQTDQEGKTTAYEYDVIGNLTKVTDAMGFATVYTYDTRNNRVSQTDANGNTTSFAYDNLSRMISKTYPNGNKEEYVYDQIGRVTTKTMANGDTESYEYDFMGRDSLKTYSNSGHTVTTEYFTDGRKKAVTDYRGVTSYTYDSRGRLASVTNPDGKVIEYAYDVQGNRTELKTAFSTTTYAFDELNREKTVTADAKTTSYTYNAVGNRIKTTHSNGSVSEFSYDGLNRLTKVENEKSDGTVLSSFEYTLNDAGIRTGVTENDGSTVAYTYDDNYRLVSEVRTGSNAYSSSFTYDNVANRLRQIKDGALTTYSYNTRDQLTSEVKGSESTTYTYDVNGRQVAKDVDGQVQTFTWVDNDRLASVTKADGSIQSYTYDASGRRVSETDGTDVTNYLIDGTLPYGQTVADYANDGTEIASYIYGLERLSQDRGGVQSIYLADGQGSVRQLVDDSENVTDAMGFTAFGEELYRTGTTENRFGYTGEAWDANLQMQYLRARYYNPSVGRFVSVDPFEGLTESPISLHRYLYANASPLSWSDPTGNIALANISVARVAGAIVRTGYRNVEALTLRTGMSLAAKILATTGAVSGLALSYYLSQTIDDPADVAKFSLAERARELGRIQRRGKRVRVFRGVSSTSSHYGAALLGMAIPVGGHRDPIRHNRDEKNSAYTSWSFRRNVAVRFATGDPSKQGVVLEDWVNPRTLIPSPDLHDEDEVLRIGIIVGALPTDPYTGSPLIGR